MRRFSSPISVCSASICFSQKVTSWGAVSTGPAAKPPTSWGPRMDALLLVFDDKFITLVRSGRELRPQPDDADNNQIQGHNIVEEARHQQNQNAGDQRD